MPSITSKRILMRSYRLGAATLFGCIALFGATAFAANPKSTSPNPPSRIASAHDRQQATLAKELAEKRLELGSPLFIRAFKSDGKSDGGAEGQGALNKSARIEVWIKTRRGTYERFKSFPICAISGKLGPKLKEGDLQVPEGVYSIRRDAVNPESAFHISYDIGYPNAVDRARGATGSEIRVHGKCQSWGCLALGFSKDEQEIESLTVLIHQAWQNGQKEVPIHIFPFPMSDQSIRESLRELGPDQSLTERHWSELKPIYESFERTRVPPAVDQSQGRYEIAGARN